MRFDNSRAQLAWNRRQGLRRKWFGLYDLTAIAIGIPISLIIYSSAMQVPLHELTSPQMLWGWTGGALVISNWLTARIWKRLITGAEGVHNLFVAMGAGLFNATLFALLLVGPPGLIMGPIAALGSYVLLVPLSVGAQFTMRWAATLDEPGASHA